MHYKCLLYSNLYKWCALPIKGMASLANKIATVVSIFLIGGAPVYGKNYGCDFLLNKIKHHIRHERVDLALSLADKVSNPDCLHYVALAFAHSGNPSRASSYNKHPDPEKRYEVIKVIAEKGNPVNAMEDLQTMPLEYVKRGIKLLNSLGYHKQASILEQSTNK
jgi:hypothetical protein